MRVTHRETTLARGKGRIEDRGRPRVAVACVIAAHLLVAGVAADGAGQPPGAVPADAPATVAVATDRFVLVTTPRRFVLRSVSGEARRDIAIPRAWLIPRAEERKEEGAYVSSFNYGTAITSFAVGDGRTGLHLSSYALMTDGSAQAAAGRDVFLVLDERTGVVGTGLATLGITKGRVRSEGCARAEAAHFVVGDVDGDGLVDIGVVRESIRCPVPDDDERAARRAPPRFSQEPVQWFVYRNGRWRASGDYRGQIRAGAAALPLIGMELTPVDYVGYGYWKSHVPARWGSAGDVPYEPPHRRRLIDAESRARPGGAALLPTELVAGASNGITADFGGTEQPAGTPPELRIPTLWFTQNEG